MQLASKWGNAQIVELLLEHGADHCATQCVRERRPGDLYGTHGKYYTTRGKALEVASLAGHEETVCLLLQLRFSKDLTKKDFRKAIHYGARGGHTRIVSILIENTFNKCSADWWNAIQDVFLIASYHGHGELVKLMLEKGVNINLTKQEGVFGYPSALLLAASRGHKHILQLLFDHGISRDVVYESCANSGIVDNTAMTMSAENGYEEVVQLLIDYGTDVNAQLRGGFVIQRAARSGQSSMLNFLLNRGADLNGLSEDGRHLVGEIMLVDAVRKGQLPIVNILIQAGVPPNNSDELIDPVLAAMAYGQTHVLKALIKQGARQLDPMESCLAADFKHGKYPLYSDHSEERSCYWEGRY